MVETRRIFENKLEKFFRPDARRACGFKIERSGVLRPSSVTTLLGTSVGSFGRGKLFPARRSRDFLFESHPSFAIFMRFPSRKSVSTEHRGLWKTLRCVYITGRVNMQVFAIATIVSVSHLPPGCHIFKFCGGGGRRNWVKPFFRAN